MKSASSISSTWPPFWNHSFFCSLGTVCENQAVFPSNNFADLLLLEDMLMREFGIVMGSDFWFQNPLLAKDHCSRHLGNASKEEENLFMSHLFQRLFTVQVQQNNFFSIKFFLFLPLKTNLKTRAEKVVWKIKSLDSGTLNTIYKLWDSYKSRLFAFEAQISAPTTSL